MPWIVDAETKQLAININVCKKLDYFKVMFVFLCSCIFPVKSMLKERYTGVRLRIASVHF